MGEGLQWFFSTIADLPGGGKVCNITPVRLSIAVNGDQRMFNSIDVYFAEVLKFYSLMDKVIDE